MIELKKINKIYNPHSTTPVLALNDINISLPEVGFIAIVGESGSGKTTLLNILGCLDHPTSGTFFLNGEDMSQMNECEKSDFYASKIGMIFQDYNVFDDLSVFDNIKLSAETIHCIDTSINQEIKDTLSLLGLDGCEQKLVKELSGGQKQRVAIARALIKKPSYILADEPTGNLDSRNSEIVFNKLREISKKTLVICVTHDKDAAKIYCDKIITLKDGQIDTSFNIYNTDNTDKTFTQIKLSKTHTKAKQTVPFRKLTTYSNQILKKNKKKNFINFITISTVVFLVLLFCNLLFYNTCGVLEDYLKQYGINGFAIKKNYIDNNNKEINTISFSKELYSISNKVVYNGYSYLQIDDVEITEKQSMLTTKEEQMAGKFENKSIRASIRKIKNTVFQTQFNLEKTSGNEIIVSEAIATYLNKNINDKIYINGHEAIIKGIINKDVSSDYKLLDGEEQEFCYNNYYSFAYISENFGMISDSCNKLYIPAAFYEDSLFDYTRHLLSYSSYNNQTIVEGSIPYNQNEIVITYDFLDKIGFNSEQILGHHYRLFDLYASKNCHMYDSLINLYDFIGNEVIVVGIVDSDCDVLLNKDSYNILLKEYPFYEYSSIGLKSTNLKHTIKILLNEDCTIKDPFLNLMYEIINTQKKIKPFIILVLITLIIIYVMIIVSFILFFVNENAKNIGILKSLGYNYKELRHIFLLNQLKLVLQAESIGLILYILTIIITNNIVKGHMVVNSYAILKTNIKITLLIILFMFSCSLIAAIIPLKRINKMTIISAVKTSQ